MINFRSATIDDIEMVFHWSNDPGTRINSYNPNKILYKDHVHWFHNQIENEDSVILIFEEDNSPIGLVRFKEEDSAWVVGINISKENRGKGFAIDMLKMSAKYMFETYNCNAILAYIKQTNKASIKAFEKAGYWFNKSLLIHNIKSYQYKLTKDEIL